MRARSTGCASRTRTGRASASSTGRSRRTRRSRVHTAWGRTLKDVFQRYKALRGLRPALPERLRLPGPLDRGRRRARARAQLEARDRGVRARRVRAQVPRGRRAGRRRSSRRARSASASGWTGGRDYFTFSDTNIEYIWKFLADRPRARLARTRPPLDRVVPALRDVDLGARAAGQLRGPDRSVALRALPAARPRRRGARRLDDDAVDAARERRRGGQPGRRVRPARERRLGRGRALPGRDVHAARQGRGARRAPLPRARSTRSPRPPRSSTA